MARLSNETLAQTISVTVNRLEKRLKEDEQKRLEHQKLLEQRFSDAQNFEFDLKPLKEEFYKQLEHLEQVNNQTRTSIKNPLFTWKIILVYLASLVIVGGLMWMMNNKAHKERAEASKKTEFLKEYINSSEERTADFQKWLKG